MNIRTCHNVASEEYSSVIRSPSCLFPLAVGLHESIPVLPSVLCCDIQSSFSSFYSIAIAGIMDHGPWTVEHTHSRGRADLVCFHSRQLAGRCEGRSSLSPTVPSLPSTDRVNPHAIDFRDDVMREYSGQKRGINDFTFTWTSNASVTSSFTSLLSVSCCDFTEESCIM